MCALAGADFRRTDPEEQLEIIRLILHVAYAKDRRCNREGTVRQVADRHPGIDPPVQNDIEGKEQNLDILQTGDFTGELD